MSDEVKLIQRFDDFKTFLLKHNYPGELIKCMDLSTHGIKRALETDRETLRNKVPVKDENIIPYVSTFNPRNTEIFPVIKRNLPILYQDDKLKY